MKKKMSRDEFRRTSARRTSRTSQFNPDTLLQHTPKSEISKVRKAERKARAEKRALKWARIADPEVPGRDRRGERYYKRRRRLADAIPDRKNPRAV